MIVEEDLIDALNSGKVYAAGLDATAYDNGHHATPLMDCDNARITAHIAWFPMEARLRDIEIAALNLKNYLEGHPPVSFCRTRNLYLLFIIIYNYLQLINYL